jgi:hypothetical protein
MIINQVDDGDGSVADLSSKLDQAVESWLRRCVEHVIATQRGKPVVFFP